MRPHNLEVGCCHPMTKKPKGIAKRKCRYCKGEFKPARAYPVMRFCCDSHRKLYHKYGSLPLEKILDRAEARAREIAAAEIRAIREQVERMERDLTEARAESSKALAILSRSGAAA